MMRTANVIIPLCSYKATIALDLLDSCIGVNVPIHAHFDFK